MRDRVCLRCDWTGGNDGAACPRCGAPLYRVQEPTAPREAGPAPRPEPQPAANLMPSSRTDMVQDDESVPPAVPVPASRRWWVIGGGAFTVAAVLIVATGLPFDRARTPAVPGPTETGPAETGVENPEPTPVVVPAPIGTVTRSEAGCVLQLDAGPIPPGAGRLSLVNEMKRWVSFELLRFDPEVLTFAQLEVMVANGEYKGGTFTFAPPGVFELAQAEVGPGASGVITDDFTTGDTFAVVCLDRRRFDSGFPTRGNPENFVLVGPIVVPAETAPTLTAPTAIVTAPPSPPASRGPTVVEQEMCSDGARVRLELTNLGGVTGLFSSIQVRFELHRSPVGHDWRILIERFSSMDPPTVWMRGTRVASDSGDLVNQRTSFRDGVLRLWFRAKALDRQTGQVCTVSATAARRE